VWAYRADILETLAGHGVRPTAETPPELVRGFVSELYRWEIRQLRDELRRKAFPKASYAGRVIELRKRYLVLSVPVEHWTDT
jgi:hypothetical protein